MHTMGQRGDSLFVPEKSIGIKKIGKWFEYFLFWQEGISLLEMRFGFRIISLFTAHDMQTGCPDIGSR